MQPAPAIMNRGVMRNVMTKPDPALRLDRAERPRVRHPAPARREQRPRAAPAPADLPRTKPDNLAPDARDLDRTERQRIRQEPGPPGPAPPGPAPRPAPARARPPAPVPAPVPA